LRAGLAVTARGDAEDPLHVLAPGAFAAVELGDAVVPAEVREVHRRAGLDAVPVGVVADLVPLERADDVPAAAAFKGTGLLADDLERGPDLEAGEQVGHAERGVVAGRQ